MIQHHIFERDNSKKDREIGVQLSPGVKHGKINPHTHPNPPPETSRVLFPERNVPITMETKSRGPLFVLGVGLINDIGVH